MPNPRHSLLILTRLRRIKPFPSFSQFLEDWDATALWKMFSRYGKVVDVYIAFKRTKRGTRFEYVMFINIENLLSFKCRLKGILIGDSQLNIHQAKFTKDGGANLLRGGFSPFSLIGSMIPLKTVKTILWELGKILEIEKLDFYAKILHHVKTLVLLPNMSEGSRSDKVIGFPWIHVDPMDICFGVFVVFMIGISGIGGDNIRELVDQNSHIFVDIQESKTGLFDLPLEGRRFTRFDKDGRKASKLDRFMVSSSFFMFGKMPVSRFYVDHTSITVLSSLRGFLDSGDKKKKKDGDGVKKDTMDEAANVGIAAKVKLIDGKLRKPIRGAPITMDAVDNEKGETSNGGKHTPTKVRFRPITTSTVAIPADSKGSYNGGTCEAKTDCSFTSLVRPKESSTKVHFRAFVNDEKLELFDCVLPKAVASKIKSRYENSIVGFFLGKDPSFPVPIMLDAFTSSMCVESWGRISFARALIEVSASSALKKEVIMAVLEDEGDGYVKEVIRVEYEWKPPHCVDFQSFSHDSKLCPKRVREEVPKNSARDTKATTMEENDDGFTEVKIRKKKKGVDFGGIRLNKPKSKVMWQQKKGVDAKSNSTSPFASSNAVGNDKGVSNPGLNTYNLFDVLNVDGDAMRESRTQPKVSEYVSSDLNENRLGASKPSSSKSVYGDGHKDKNISSPLVMKKWDVINEDDNTDDEDVFNSYGGSLGGGNQLEDEDFDFYEGYADQVVDIDGALKEFRDFKLRMSEGLKCYKLLIAAGKRRQVDSNHRPFNKTPTALDKLLKEFQDVFAVPNTLPPHRSHDHINVLQVVPPVNVRPYKHPPTPKDAIELMVKELLETGVIRNNHIPFSSPIVMVKKKDGTWRMCIDYRQLKKHTIKDKFPIPFIKELIDELSGAQVFIKLDLRSGYHKIRIANEDVHKTTFKTREGHYEFLAKKVFFCCGLGRVLGYVISAKRIATDPSKIASMKDWPIPKSIKELRGFLGLTRFYRRFIKGFAIISQPLTSLLKKNAFKWSDVAQEAFEELKQAMFVVETDASKVGLGAVLK
nr:Ty3/gypsy retrotransposon protein [Tanacetum cinerariifolium]